MCNRKSEGQVGHQRRSRTSDRSRPPEARVGKIRPTKVGKSKPALTALSERGLEMSDRHRRDLVLWAWFFLGVIDYGAIEQVREQFLVGVPSQKPR